MDYVNNDDQLTRKTAIPQHEFLDLVNLVLTTTWYTFDSQFYKQIGGISMEEQHLKSKRKFTCRLINALQYLQHCTPRSLRTFY